MKWSILGVLFFVAYTMAGDEDFQEQMMKIAEECCEENGVSQGDMFQMAEEDLKSEDVKQPVKCALNCMMVRFGTMDDAGQFLPEVAKEKFKDTAFGEMVGKVSDACKDIKAANPCETAYEVTRCMYLHKDD